MYKYIGYCLLLLYLLSSIHILYYICNILLQYINIYIFNIITYGIIAIVQLDNLTIYNDFIELQKKYEKLVKDEYRMKVLSIKYEKYSI